MCIFLLGESEVKRTITLTVDPDVFSRFKAKYGNASATIENLMRRSLADSDRERFAGDSIRIQSLAESV